MELSSIVPAPPPPPLPPQLSPSFQPPVPAQIQPPTSPTSTSTPPTPTPATATTPPVPGGNQPLTQPRAETTQTPLQQAFAQPRFQLGNQPGPWPQAFPASPVFTSPDQYPPLPGETPDETQHLNNFAWREAPKGNVMNDIAAKDPSQYGQGHTDQGYWQIVNTTWQDGAAKAGVNLQQYPTAMGAPYQVQRQVALALYRAYGDKPWASSAGAGERGDKFQLASQQIMLPPQRRDAQDWGHPPPVTGSMPGATPPESEWAKVLNTVSPLLLAIGSIALRLPLSSAITAYGAMSRAQYNGQKDEYERSRTQFQDKLNESNAQQTLESKDASDAFDTYGQNNPQGLQQRLMQIALTYNDPALYTTAAKGDLNGAYKLQADRDLHNQSLTKVNDAVRKQQEEQAQDAAIKAMDDKWRADNPNASEADFAIAHNQHIGEAARAGTKDPKGESTKEEAQPYDVVDKNTGEVTRQVRLGQGGGLFDLTGKATTLAPNEKLGEKTGTKTAEEKPKTANFQWTDPDGNTQSGYATFTPGKGLSNPTDGSPIPIKPGSMPREISTSQAGEGERTDKLYDVVEKQPDGSEQIVTSGLELRLTPKGYVHAEDNKPLELGPNQRVRQTTPTTTTGGRAGAQTLRQMVAAEEVRGDLSGIANLPIGTTVGASGILHPGDRTVWEATLGTLARKLTTQDQGLMEDSMAGIQRELSTLMSPVYGGKYASDQIDILTPKPGDNAYRVLDKLARIRQSADNAITALKNAPWITPDQKKELDEISKGMGEAIPWTVGQVRDFLHQKNPHITFREFVAGGGIGGGGQGQSGSGLPPGVTVEVH